MQAVIRRDKCNILMKKGKNSLLDSELSSTGLYFQFPK